MASPIIVLFIDEPLELITTGWFDITVDEPVEALWLVPVGLIAYLALVHIVVSASSLHAAWARLMLGSSAVPRNEQDAPVVPPDGEPPRFEESDQPSREVHSPAPQPTSAKVQPFVPAAAIGISDPAYQEAVARFGELTPRESEIVGLIARGLNNAEIAETCFISQGTVKTHVKRVLAKLGLRDRAQVVVFAYEIGIASPAVAGPADEEAGGYRSQTN